MTQETLHVRVSYFEKGSVLFAEPFSYLKRIKRIYNRDCRSKGSRHRNCQCSEYNIRHRNSHTYEAVQHIEHFLYNWGNVLP